MYTQAELDRYKAGCFVGQPRSDEVTSVDNYMANPPEPNDDWLVDTGSSGSDFDGGTP